MRKQVIILGGGAAGLMCAIEAGKRGRSVLVLERSERIGNKILISGGGHCNFTNLRVSSENYLSQNPNFCKSALARYAPEDFISMIERHGIRYHEKKLGQLFCEGSAKEIVRMLERECREVGVEIRTSVDVLEVLQTKNFEVRTASENFQTESLVVATGGLSLPKLGATDLGYRLAYQFGLTLVKRRPGLVPFTFIGEDLKFFSELSGVTLPVKVRCEEISFEENLLLTHRGLSGPAILQISSFWNEGHEIEIDLLPGIRGEEWLLEQRSMAANRWETMFKRWPSRFTKAWCSRFFPPKELTQWRSDQLREAGRLLNNWRLVPMGTEGYHTAEVTMGGVDTRELSSQTMESRKVRGLYFIGEVTDVTGWLGGYNFHWAWASGHAAGMVV